MLYLSSPQIAQETLLRWKKDHRIAFVPTMGNLHDGHLSLVKHARTLGTKVVVSIFVNPLQFGPNEDFDNYPRTLEQDEQRLEALDVDLLFAPSVKELYPDPYNTRVRVEGTIPMHLCGSSRTNHFEGVATVCLKLFQTTLADFAVFGQKDFQQFRVIEQMVGDLNLPLGLSAQPTVRESDGLALSSRNQYLDDEQRSQASQIYAALRHAKELASTQPDATIGEILTKARQTVTGQWVDFEYLKIASETNLVPLKPEELLSQCALPRIFAAARVGKTRLIDNLSLY